MRKPMLRRVTFGASIVAALAIPAAIVTLAQEGKDDGSGPRTEVDRPAYATAVAENEARQRPQLEFLTEFAESGQAARSLPLVELDAASAPPQPVSRLGEVSEVVAVMEIVRVEYGGANIGDLPATRVTYRTIEGVRGTDEGAQQTVTLAGGPYQSVDGSVVALTLPFEFVPVSGDIVVAFLRRGDSGELVPALPGSVFRIQEDIVLHDRGADRYDVGDLTVDELLRRADVS
jgi:hypothetical protein